MNSTLNLLAPWIHAAGIYILESVSDSGRAAAGGGGGAYVNMRNTYTELSSFSLLSLLLRLFIIHCIEDVCLEEWYSKYDFINNTEVGDENATMKRESSWPNRGGYR